MRRKAGRRKRFSRLHSKLTFGHDGPDPSARWAFRHRFLMTRTKAYLRILSLFSLVSAQSISCRGGECQFLPALPSRCGERGSAFPPAFRLIARTLAARFPACSQQNGKRKLTHKSWQTYESIIMAAGEGFEPSHTESESAVLPLHNPAIFIYRRRLTTYIIIFTNRKLSRGILKIF